MKDIQDRADIELLVNAFYDKVKKNDTIGFIFIDVARVDWEHHLPRLYDFWETALMGNAVFKGNPMLKHLLLSKETELGKIHFDTWLQLWHATVEEHFAGEMAEQAKQKAANIAALMLYKISQN